MPWGTSFAEDKEPKNPPGIVPLELLKIPREVIWFDTSQCKSAASLYFNANKESYDKSNLNSISFANGICPFFKKNHLTALHSIEIDASKVDEFFPDELEGIRSSTSFGGGCPEGPPCPPLEESDSTRTTLPPSSASAPILISP